MGVCECSRLGCEEIMCKDLTVFGNYICYDCQKEFKEQLKYLGYPYAKRDYYDEKLWEYLNNGTLLYISPERKNGEISIDEYFSIEY